MLNVFTLTNGRLFQEEIDSLAGLADVKPVWVDLESPTSDEKAWISERFGVNIPSDAVDDDLEESARFYEEDNGELHIRSDFLIDAGDGPDAEPARNVRVAFILVRNVLFTIHGEDLPVFRLLRLRARRVSIMLRRMRPFRSSSRAIAASASAATLSLTSSLSTRALTFSSLS